MLHTGERPGGKLGGWGHASYRLETRWEVRGLGACFIQVRDQVRSSGVGGMLHTGERPGRKLGVGGMLHTFERPGGKLGGWGHVLYR